MISIVRVFMYLCIRLFVCVCICDSVQQIFLGGRPTRISGANSYVQGVHLFKFFSEKIITKAKNIFLRKNINH